MKNEWYEDMLQSLRTPFLLQSLRTLKIDPPGNKPIKLGRLQPTYGHSHHASYKTKVKTESKMVPTKNREKVQAMLTQSINQPSNNMGVRRLWGISSYNANLCSELNGKMIWVLTVSIQTDPNPLMCLRQADCGMIQPVGLSAGWIPETAMKGTSDVAGFELRNIRLNSLTGWCAQPENFTYAEINLGRIYRLQALRLKGNQMFNWLIDGLTDLINYS